LSDREKMKLNICKWLFYEQHFDWIRNEAPARQDNQ
jgi:hypothetical protein